MPWGDCTGPWWAQGGRRPRRGWFGRGWGWGPGPWWADDYTQPPYYDEETEKAYLKSRESWLKQALENIRNRLRQLGEEE